MFAPQTQVYILADVQCDVSGKNVKDFTDASQQYAYHRSKSKYMFETCATQGVVGYTGYILVPIGNASPAQYPNLTIDSYYNCNYMMYRNQELSGKWIYAFLGTPEPLNSGCVRIPYTIDPWATWQFDITLGQCLIHRQTVLDDTIGLWLLPEDIETGEYYIVDKAGSEQYQTGYDLLSQNGYDTDPCLLIIYSFSPGHGDNAAYIVEEITNGLSYKFAGMKPVFAGGYMEGGVYQGAQFAWIDFHKSQSDWYDRIDYINDVIKQLVGQGQIDKIQAMYMLPKGFFRTAEFSGTFDGTQLSTRIPKKDTVDLLPSPTYFGQQGSVSTASENQSMDRAAINSYTPVNKKMLTQQYNYYVIDDGEGSQNEFGYEYTMSGDHPRANIYSQLSDKPTMAFVPLAYKSRALAENPMYTMQIKGWPLASYSYSQYTNDVNANRWSNAVGAARNVYGAAKNVITNAVMGNFVGAAEGAVDAALDAASTVAEYHDKARIPNAIAGQSDPNINYPLGRLTFTQYRMQISPEYARKADRYLTAYGYRTDVFGVPSRKGRRYFNYLQLVDPVVEGNAPAEIKQQITNMLSAGLRIWHFTQSIPQPGSGQVGGWSHNLWLDYEHGNPILSTASTQSEEVM